jgi:hypothetical protein
MSGNFLLLVCAPCGEAKEYDFGFKLAKRGLIGAYDVFGPALATKNLQAWLRKHAGCAGKGHPDHFVLAHIYQRDHDQPKPKMALVQ